MLRTTSSSGLIAAQRVSASIAPIVILLLLLPAMLWADSDGNLSPEAAMRRIMEQGEESSFVLLDVRTPGEYNKGHIQGAKLLDYYHPGFLKRLKALDREKTYLLYCRTGNRSGRTLDVMGKLGFKQATHLAGGTVAWQSKGYSLVKSKVVNPDLVAP